MESLNLGSDPAESAPTVEHLVAVLRRQKRLILTLFTVVAIGMTTWVLLMPPNYEGTMKFLVRNARADMVVTSDLRSSVYPGGVSEAEMNSEIELLNSRDLLEKVASRTLIAKDESPVSPKRLERAVRELENHLQVAVVRRANIISVAYVARTPALAVDVLRQLSDLYLDKHLTTHRTVGAYAFFKAQSEHYKDDLTRVEAEMSEFRTQHNISLMEAQKDLLVKRGGDLQMQFVDVSAAMNETRQRIARLHTTTESMAETAVVQTRAVPNQFSIERLNTMLVELKNRRTLMLAKFQPDDLLVKELEQEIHDTDAALTAAQTHPALESSTEPNPIRESLLSDLAKAEVQLAGLEARRESIKASTDTLDEEWAALEAATPEHDALERALKTAEGNFQLYETKREEARIAEALDQQKITNVSVAQAPSAPGIPSGPSRAMLLLVGVCVAGFISLGSALGADFVRGGTEALSGRPRAGATDKVARVDYDLGADPVRVTVPALTHFAEPASVAYQMGTTRLGRQNRNLGD